MPATTRAASKARPVSKVRPAAKAHPAAQPTVKAKPARAKPATRRAPFQPSALASSLSIAATKKNTTDPQKRAAVVLRSGMRSAEFHRIEGQMHQNNVARMPIVIVRGEKSLVPDIPLCGLVITGVDKTAHPEEAAALRRVVQEAADRNIPILALSDAAPIALAVLGHKAPNTPHTAVLIDNIENNVHGLATRIDVRRAIDGMAVD